MRKGRIGQRGQALVEGALVVPILLTLLAGSWSAAQLASAQNIANIATSNGARLGAALGNGNANLVTGPFDPTAVDEQIVQVVVGSMKSASGSVIDHLEIYQPVSVANGGAELLTDCYAPDGTPCSSPAYTLDKRLQVPPVESFIGVKIYFTFTPPTPLGAVFAGMKSDYTVMQLVPYE